MTNRCPDMSDRFLLHLNSSRFVLSLYLYQNIGRNLSGQKSNNMKSAIYILLTYKLLQLPTNTIKYHHSTTMSYNFTKETSTSSELYYKRQHINTDKMKTIRNIMGICQTNTSEIIRKHLSSPLNSS